MKLLIALLTTLFSAHAFATDFNGHWIASSGTMIDAGGKTTPCTKIEVELKQEATKITIVRYHAICGMMDSEWGPDPMNVQGEKVLNDDGDEIGKISGPVLETSEGISGTLYVFNAKIAADSSGAPVLENLYAVQNFIGNMKVQGELHLAR